MKGKHRYAVLKRCRERDIVRPPTLVQITPELPTATVFFSRVARNLVGSAKKSAVMTGMTSTPRSASHYRGNVVIVTALTTGALPSSCRYISGMQDAADLNFECHGKGCENLCTCDFSFICHFLIHLQRFQTNFFHVVIMEYCL